MLTTAACLTLHAQTFKSRVDSVRLDALVVANRQPVLGLSADDFEVRDNGVLQKVTLLGTGSLPLDVILVLDMSGSLPAERLEALRAAAGTLLAALESDDRAALATFSYEIHRAQALTSDFASVRRGLERVKPSGGTALVDAMYAAIGMNDPGERRGLMIVFSDGIDTASWLQPTAVIGAAQRSEITIYAVSTAMPAHTPALLREVTEETGGKLLEVDSASLATAFTRVLNEFRQRYVLSYTLPGTAAEGWHRIEVRVKKRNAVVKARPGYRIGRR